MFANWSLPNVVFCLVTVFTGALATHNIGGQRGDPRDQAYGASGQDCMTYLYDNCAYRVGSACSSTGSGVTASHLEFDVWGGGIQPGQIHHDFRPSESAWDSCYSHPYPYSRVIDCGTITKDCTDRQTTYHCYSKTMHCKR